MKKILAILLACSLLFGMAGCSSGPKPEDTVKKLFEAVKAFDFETMSTCFQEDFDPGEIISPEEEDLTGLIDYLKGNAANIKYTIGKAEINEDKAIVPVSAEYTDASEVLGETFANFFVQMFAMVFSDGSEEDMEKAFSDSLAAAVESKETGTATKDCRFEMVLVEDEWKIVDMPEEMADIMTSNLISAMENIGDIFGGEDSDWSMGEEPVEYPISDEVLLDNDDARITIQSGGTDEWGNINFSVLCENKSSKDVTFRLENLVVNGWAVGGSLYEDVAAGKSAVGDMDIWASDIAAIGLETPDKVTAQLQIYNEDEWWDDIYMVNEPVTFYPTGLSDAEITVPGRPSADGEVVLADNDVFTMILVDNSEGEWGGFNIRAYIKNKTDRAIYVDWEDVSMNGFMIDPYCGKTIPAGQQAMNDISFAANEIEDAGIETAESIEFTLRVADDTNGEELFSEKMTYEP